MTAIFRLLVEFGTGFCAGMGAIQALTGDTTTGAFLLGFAILLALWLPAVRDEA